jgi:hypothetical protein
VLLRTRAVAAQLVDGAVAGDAGQPGGYLGAVGAILPGALPDAEKDVLGNLFGSGGIDNRVEGQAKDKPAVAVVQLAQGLRPSLYDQADKGLIVGCRNVRWSHRLPAGKGSSRCSSPAARL